MTSRKSPLSCLDELGFSNNWEAIRNRPIGRPLIVSGPTAGRGRRIGTIAFALAIFASTLLFFIPRSTNDQDRKADTIVNAATDSPRELVAPTQGSVADGRFVEAVQLDDGLFRVDVAPSDLAHQSRRLMRPRESGQTPT